MESSQITKRKQISIYLSTHVKTIKSQLCKVVMWCTAIIEILIIVFAPFVCNDLCYWCMLHMPYLIRSLLVFPSFVLLVFFPPAEYWFPSFRLHFGFLLNLISNFWMKKNFHLNYLFLLLFFFFSSQMLIWYSSESIIT